MQTTIEWTATYLSDGTMFPGYTFNPWWGCAKYSPGCKFCYAETWDTRWKGDHWGINADRRKFGDKHSYAGSGKAKGDLMANKYKQDTNRASTSGNSVNAYFKSKIYKPKDLIGVPWMLAFALRKAGWYLRQDIIWNKPNPMPESVTDRCTKAHEYIFLLSKSNKYYFDNDAIKTNSIDPDRDFKRAFNQNWENKSVPDKLVNGIRPRKSVNIERKPGVERGCPENSGSNVASSIPWEGTTDYMARLILDGMKANQQ